MRNIWFTTAILLGSVFLPVVSNARAYFKPLTQLTPQGNIEASELFRKYKNHSEGCATSGIGKRVLLTGFGPFQSVAINSAGAIVTNIADPRTWPDQVPINENVTLLNTAPLHEGRFKTDKGAKVFNRSLRIGQNQYELCVLVLDVLWDVAGAIVAYEMDRFQPEAVLMLGGGGGPILEAGALNEAAFVEGYYWDGSASMTNLPVRHPILPLSEKYRELPMAWDNQKIRRKVEPLLVLNRLELNTAHSARSENNYLCNHVSFVALAAARGFPIQLAGGLISFQPTVLSNPKVGFFHLPWNLQVDEETVRNWGSLVTTILFFMTNL